MPQEIPTPPQEFMDRAAVDMEKQPIQDIAASLNALPDGERAEALAGVLTRLDDPNEREALQKLVKPTIH